MRKSIKGLMAAGIAAMLAGSLSAASTDIKTSGYVDAYYQFNLNGHTPVDRVYDTTQGQFDLGGVQYSLSAKNGDTSGQIDVLYGEQVAANTFNNQDFAIAQAFGTQTLGPVDVSLGKMLTFIGNESLYSTGNWNYSRSLIFSAEPIWGLGVRAAYSPMENLKVLAEIDNGTNAYFSPNGFSGAGNLGHGYGAQVAYTLGSLGLTGSWYMSDENQNNNNIGENTHYLNFIATYGMGSLNFAGEYLYKTYVADPNKNGLTGPSGLPYSPKAQGYAVYADYDTPVKGFSVVGRFEQLFNPDQKWVGSILANTNDIQQNEITVSLKYKMGNLTNFLELRNDSTPNNRFQPAGGASSLSQLVNSQMTITYGAVISF